jgi:hypothetical protein
LRVWGVGETVGPGMPRAFLFERDQYRIPILGFRG